MPWKTLGMDLFLHNRNVYLLVVDYYSKLQWAQTFSVSSTNDVTSALSFCFSVFNTTKEVICYNDTKFTSKQ